MDSMCKALIKAGDRLFTHRSSLESLWQEIGDHFYPERAQFTHVFSLGEEFADHLMTSYPVLARRDLGNSFASMLRTGDWFKLTTARDEPPDQAAEEYLEWLAQTQKRAMYAGPANFRRATKEGDHDFAAFGQCAISVELNQAKSDLLYRCWHLKDVAWSENADGKIDTFHVRWCPTAEELCRMFPKAVSQKVKDIKEKEPFTEVKCRRIIVPADAYERKQGKPWRTPYVSITVDVDNETILEEVGVINKVFCLPRWQTVSGSQYAYSPATIVALPDARLIQQMTLTLLEAGEKAVNPPTYGYKEAFRSDLDLRAGGHSWVDAAYDDRTGEPIKPVFNDRYGLPAGFEMRDDIRAMIQEAFYLNKLSLPPQGDMTAYEVSQRVQEYIRQALPIFEPLETEYNGQLCDMTFELMMKNGGFSKRPMPRSLRGQDIEFRFESPLQSARDADKTVQFTQTAQLLAQAMQLDDSLRADVDVRQAFRDAVKGTGAPADWLNDEAEVEEAVAQLQQFKQQQMQAAQMQQGAETLETVSRAVSA